MRDSVETAAVLAGGLATRLQGAVDDRPKCLAEVQGRPFLAYLLELLRRQGFTSAVLLVGHLHEQVAEVFGQEWRGVRIRYSVEPAPLGTAGAAKLAAPLLSDPFLLLNGDTLTEANLRGLYDAHRANSGTLGTVALAEVSDVSPFGAVTLDAAGHITGFHEKDSDRHEPGLVNAGAYCFSHVALSQIPSETVFSIETQLLPRLVERTRALQAFRFKGGFVDIGTPDRLADAQTHPLFSALAPVKDGAP